MYIIRNLDNDVSTSSDIEQYKLLHVTEEPVSNKQQHLDVMCFPVLFPNEISCLFPSSDNERPGSGHCRSLLLEEGIPESWYPS